MEEGLDGLAYRRDGAGWPSVSDFDLIHRHGKPVDTVFLVNRKRHNLLGKVCEF